MSRIPLAESLIVLDANNDVCNVSRFCETTFNVLFAQLTEIVHGNTVDDCVQILTFHPEVRRIPDLKSIQDRNIFRPEYTVVVSIFSLTLSVVAGAVFQPLGFMLVLIPLGDGFIVFLLQFLL